MGAEAGIETDDAAQQRTGEALANLVMNIHTDNAQELPHFVASQTPHVETESGQRRQVLPVMGAQPRRRPVQDLAQEFCIARRALAKVSILLGIFRGDAFDSSAGDPHVLALLSERDRRHVLGGEGRRDLQVPAYIRLQLVKQVGTGRHREFVRKLARHCSAADLAGRLEHQHALARPGQHSGADQAVVPGSDDDRIVAVSHRRNSPERCSYAAGRQESRAPRWRPAPP